MAEVRYLRVRCRDFVQEERIKKGINDRGPISEICKLGVQAEIYAEMSTSGTDISRIKSAPDVQTTDC
jgi:hypothetical protein